MVEAEQVQDRRVEVAYMNGNLHDVIGEVSCFAINRSAFGTAAGHPHRKATWVMISAVVFA